MWNRQEMLNRIRDCHRQGVPITNYGLVIAYALGILERALAPFPEALAAYKKAREERQAMPTVSDTSDLNESNMSLVN